MKWLAPLVLAAGFSAVLPGCAHVPCGTHIDRHPAKEPNWTTVVPKTDTAYYYFVGRATGKESLEEAVSDAFANAIQQILKQLETKVSYRSEKTRQLAEILKTAGAEPDVRAVNKVIESLHISGEGLIRKAKAREFYWERKVRRYGPDCRTYNESFDCYVLIQYPIEEERNLGLVATILGRRVSLSEADSLLPSLNCLDFRGTAASDQLRLEQLLRFLEPTDEFNGAFTTPNTLAFFSQTSTQSLHSELTACQKQGLLRLTAFDHIAPRRARITVHFTSSGTKFLKKLEHCRGEQTALRKIACLAQIYSMLGDEPPLQQLVLHRRDEIVRRQLHKDPGAFVNLSSGMVAERPEWSVDFLRMQMDTLGSPGTYAWNPESLSGQLEVLLDSCDAFYRERVLEVPPDNIDPKTYQYLTTITGQALDVGILGGLYGSEIHNRLRTFLRDLSGDVEEHWASKWGITSLDTLTQMYEECRWNSIATAYHDSPLPGLEPFAPEASLLMLKVCFWTENEDEFRELTKKLLSWVGAHERFSYGRVLSSQLRILLALYSLDKGCENSDAELFKSTLKTCQNDCRRNPVGSAAALLARANLNPDSVSMLEVCDPLKKLSETGQLPRPERIWTLWMLYRFLEKVDASDSLKNQFLRYLADEIRFSSTARGLDAMTITDLQNAMVQGNPGPIIRLTPSQPYVVTTSQEILVTITGTGLQGIQDLTLYVEPRASTIPIGLAGAGQASLTQTVPLDPGWNLIKVSTGQELLGFVLVLHRGVNQ